jgi:hypothetical protein
MKLILHRGFKESIFTEKYFYRNVKTLKNRIIFVSQISINCMKRYFTSISNTSLPNVAIHSIFEHLRITSSFIGACRVLGYNGRVECNGSVMPFLCGTVGVLNRNGATKWRAKNKGAEIL